MNIRTKLLLKYSDVILAWNFKSMRKILIFAPKYYCFEYLNCWQVITYLTVKHNIASVINEVFSLYFTFEFLHLLNLTEGQYCQRFDAFDSFCKELLLLFIAFGPPTKDTKKLTDNLWREIFSRGQKKIWNDHKNLKIDVVWPFVLSIFQLVKIPKEFWCTCSQSCQL